MPSWKIHDKWAKKLGIPPELSRKVNEIIDFSKEGHDKALRNSGVLISQSYELWRKYGDIAVKAFILHIQLDEMARYMRTCLVHRGHKEQYRNIDADRVVKWIKVIRALYSAGMTGKYEYHGIKYDEIISVVNNFIEENKEDIFSDIKKEILHNRDKY